MDKSLKNKAIDIKGKKYILVSDRVIYFNETYPDGQIQTELVSQPDSKTIIVKATVKPRPEQTFTGYSQAVIGDGYINKTSALENAETSAVGRALAFMGIGVIDSVASVDEINKAGVNIDYMGRIRDAKTTEELVEIGNEIKADTNMTAIRRSALRGAYESKLETFKAE